MCGYVWRIIFFHLICLIVKAFKTQWLLWGFLVCFPFQIACSFLGAVSPSVRSFCSFLCVPWNQEVPALPETVLQAGFLKVALWILVGSQMGLPLLWCCCLVTKLWCPTLCSSVDCSLPGSSVHGISQARILESESCSVVSDSLGPPGLYSPWNSPGQNIGLGSLSLLQVVFPTQESNQGLLYCRWILNQLSYQGSPKNTGVGCDFFLQGIFPTQGLNPHLLHFMGILYYQSHQGSQIWSLFYIYI